MITPKYIRGESIAGYTQRCMSSREMRKLPLDTSLKRKICKDHAELARDYLNQPFNSQG